MPCVDIIRVEITDDGDIVDMGYTMDREQVNTGSKVDREQVDMGYKVDKGHTVDKAQVEYPRDYSCTASIQREILKTVPLQIPKGERGRNRQKKDVVYKRRVRSQPSRSQTLQREVHGEINYLPRRSLSLGRISLNKSTQDQYGRRDQLIPSKTEPTTRLDGSNIDLVDDMQYGHPMLRYPAHSLPLLTWDGAPCPVHHHSILNASSVVSLGTLTQDVSRLGSTQVLHQPHVCWEPQKPITPKTRYWSGRCTGFVIVAWTIGIVTVLGILFVSLYKIMIY
jgi:hypothetical protein